MRRVSTGQGWVLGVAERALVGDVLPLQQHLPTLDTERERDLGIH